MKEPLKDLGSMLTKRIAQALLSPSAETVERNSKSGDANS
jgi:hypothetical protein